MLKTMPPAPRANRTMQVMEELQCDLITIASKKGVPQCSDHDFKYMLCVKDCFSKFCWLTPLESKEAFPISRVLAHIFHAHGAPTFLHSDNGTEFVNAIVKEVCSKFNVRIKHGRPYHPQSQGQVENLNRRVKNCLRHFLLAYDECDRSRAWPSLVTEIEYFLNHSWHHTIQCTPYEAFHGRTGSVKMGDVSAERSFMEEDFFFISADDDDLCFDLNSESSCSMSLPTHYENPKKLKMLGEMRLRQSGLNKKMFEATESTILHNKRAHIKKIKHRNYSNGQTVLFRNPNSDGLANALNVRGKVLEKIGIDLYRVQYGQENIVLFGCQMVGANTEKHSSTSDVQADHCMDTLTLDFMVEKIYEFSDVQRSYVVAKRKYKKSDDCVSIDDVTESIGLDKTDLSSLYYSALDCGFLASLTSDADWKATLIKYNEALLAYLQANYYQYYLSGIYFWETFRAQTTFFLVNSLTSQTIPLFHYCSDCVNNAPCTHSCCRLWLEKACSAVGMHSGLTGSTTSSLMLLASVAAKELEKEQNKTHKCQLTPDRSLRTCSNTLKRRPVAADIDEHVQHKRYIKRNLSSLLVSRGIFSERLQDLMKRFLQTLQEWYTLTPDEKSHFYRNVIYAVTIINREASSNEVKVAGTVPFMQIQGASNYCGLCGLNNILQKEVISVKHMNNIADDLWLRQVEECALGLSLKGNLQYHRDINGFYSFQTIEETLQCFGYSLELLSANKSLREMLSSQRPSITSSKRVLQELMTCYGASMKFLLCHRDTAHYTVVHVDNNVIWHLDSQKRSPTSLTKEAFVKKLRDHCGTTYCLQIITTEVYINQCCIMT